MNIDRLRYFAAVVETRNLRRASEIIGITPGSLSKALSTLKDELGVDLLRPEGRGIEITEQGMQIYRSSAVLLEEFHRFRDGLTQTVKASRRDKLRIGTFEVFSSYFGAEFMKSEVPDSEVKLLELPPGVIEKGVLDRMVDFGLTYLPAPDPGLAFIPIGEFQMGIFGNRAWRKQPLEEWPFAVPVTAVRIHSQEFQSLDLWPLSIKRFVKYEFELLETALQSSRLGLSVMYCPSLVIKLQNRQIKDELRLDELPSPSGLKQKPIRVFLVARKDDPHREQLGKKLARFFRGIK